MSDINHTEVAFDRLYEQWKRNTQHFSFFHMSAARPEYPQLLAFGDAAIPWILKRIQDGDHNMNLQVLLGKITGTHPDYEPEREGGFAKWDVTALADAWIRWGVERGHLSATTSEGGVS